MQITVSITCPHCRKQFANDITAMKKETRQPGFFFDIDRRRNLEEAMIEKNEAYVDISISCPGCEGIVPVGYGIIRFKESGYRIIKD